MKSLFFVLFVVCLIAIVVFNVQNSKMYRVKESSLCTEYEKEKASKVLKRNDFFIFFFLFFMLAIIAVIAMVW